MSHYLYMRFMRLPLILRILLLAILIIFVFSFLIHFLEPATFPTIFHGLWWAIVTTSTVGYGDIVPTTFKGRLLAIILILLGIGLVTSYFATLASAAVVKQKAYMKGQVAFKGVHQMIVIGWNERSRQVIKNLIARNQQERIVLIDETLDENPSEYPHFHFIKGRPTRDEVLLKANIHQAKTVLITADQNKNEYEADMHSVLTLLTIKGLNRHISCVIEILTTEQVANARRAGAEEIIQTNQLTSKVMIDQLIREEK